MNIAIVDYGVGNRTSVRHAFQRLGVSTVLTANPVEIEAADGVILPGVGSAGPALVALKEHGLDILLTQLSQPVLGICLGMQLLAGYLEEAHAPGLSILQGQVIHLQRWMEEDPSSSFSSASIERRFRVPHMGWAALQAAGGEGFDDPLLNGIAPGDAVYFAHSFALNDGKYALATTHHGELVFPAVVRCRNYWGCQFHPEKSSKVGSRMLQNFLDIAGDKTLWKE